MVTDPFKHIVIDNFLTDFYANLLLEDFDSADKENWDKREENDVQVKWRSDWKFDSEIPGGTKKVIQYLNSGDFLRKLTEYTGIEGIIPDPYLTGGGFNQINRGGCLAVHADGNWHDLMKVHRRLNLIVYLNKEWEDGWGGNLELWSKTDENTPDKCKVKIKPIWNRAVIFQTDDFSFHGHPETLNCPENVSRKSLILYYYTSERPSEELISEDKHRAVFF